MLATASAQRSDLSACPCSFRRAKERDELNARMREQLLQDCRVKQTGQPHVLDWTMPVDCECRAAVRCQQPATSHDQEQYRLAAQQERLQAAQRNADAREASGGKVSVRKTREASAVHVLQ